MLTWLWSWVVSKFLPAHPVEECDTEPDIEPLGMVYVTMSDEAKRMRDEIAMTILPGKTPVPIVPLSGSIRARIAERALR
jgi:hypothetical protein